MVCSARPVSVFTFYPTGSGDTRERTWDLLMEHTKICLNDNLKVRPIANRDANHNRFFSERQMVALVLEYDNVATDWFVAQVKRYVSDALQTGSSRCLNHSSDELIALLLKRLFDRDRHRLKRWYNEGRVRLSTCVGTLMRRICAEWLRAHWSADPTTHSCTAPHRFQDASSRSDAADRLGSNQEPPTAESESPLVSNVARMRRQAVRRATSRLLQRDAVLFRRRMVLGQSDEEISSATGVALPQLGIALQRAERRVVAALYLSYPDLFSESNSAALQLQFRRMR